MKSKNATAVLFCAILMLITASSDSLRGVFLPEFKTAFSLTEPQASRIIMISYLGNLLFLSVGGYFSDRIPRKRFIGGLLILWCAALESYLNAYWQPGIFGYYKELPECFMLFSAIRHIKPDDFLLRSGGLIAEAKRRLSYDGDLNRYMPIGIYRQQCI